MLFGFSAFSWKVIWEIYFKQLFLSGRSNTLEFQKCVILSRAIIKPDDLKLSTTWLQSNPCWLLRIPLRSGHVCVELMFLLCSDKRSQYTSELEFVIQCTVQLDHHTIDINHISRSPPKAGEIHVSRCVQEHGAVHRRGADRLCVGWLQSHLPHGTHLSYGSCSGWYLVALTWFLWLPVNVLRESVLPLLLGRRTELSVPTASHISSLITWALTTHFFFYFEG